MPEIATFSINIRDKKWQTVPELKRSSSEHRLYTRYRKLLARGEGKGKVITAIGRERLSFGWAIGLKVEAAQKVTERRAA